MWQLISVCLALKLARIPKYLPPVVSRTRYFEIGDGAFVADAVTLGEADVRGQQLILSKTIIESNSFVGNSALVPQGYHLKGKYAYWRIINAAR